MFKGILITKDDAGYKAALQTIDEAVLPAGDVTVQVEWSTLTYTDALALPGRSPVIRRFPMVPGIAFAGTSLDRPHAACPAGDTCLPTGWVVA